jgi:hypothetical protein
LNSLHFRPPGRLPVESDEAAPLLGPAGLAEDLQPLLQAGQLLAMLGEGRHTQLLQPGLALKNPLKKTTKMFFLCFFFKFFILYENNTNFVLSNRFFMNK